MTVTIIFQTTLQNAYYYSSLQPRNIVLNYIVGKKNFLPDVIKETLYILFTSFLEDWWHCNNFFMCQFFRLYTVGFSRSGAVPWIHFFILHENWMPTYNRYLVYVWWINKWSWIIEWATQYWFGNNIWFFVSLVFSGYSCLSGY